MIKILKVAIKIINMLRVGKDGIKAGKTNKDLQVLEKVEMRKT